MNTNWGLVLYHWMSSILALGQTLLFPAYLYHVCMYRAVTSQFVAIQNTLKYPQTAMLPVLQYFPFP
jgi:hypothetical protein